MYRTNITVFDITGIIFFLSGFKVFPTLLKTDFKELKIFLGLLIGRTSFIVTINGSLNKQ